MFSTKSSAGFYHAPVCKTMLGTVFTSSLVVNFPLHHHKALFVYSQSQIFSKHQLWRLLSSKVAFLDLKDLMICSVLIYYFRIFERRLGSRKFVSYLLGTGLMAVLLEVFSVFLCRKLDIPLNPLPTGPLCLIYPLFIPYYCDIPRVAMGHLMGIPVTGKSFTYILGLQMASGAPESIVVAFCGLISGLLWRANFLKIQSLIKVPRCIAQVCSDTLGHVLDSSPTIQLQTAPMGATLELQRQEQIERMEQQMIWQAVRNSQNARNVQIGRPQPQNLANGPGLFGNNNGAEENLQEQNEETDEEDSSLREVGEDEVQRLVEMGFNQEQVRHALQMSNNDISMATNFLLQES